MAVTRLRRLTPLFLAVVFAAGACSSNNNSSGGPGATSGASASGGAGTSVGQIGGQVTVLGSWSGDEEQSFLAMVKPFEDKTGVKVKFTGTRALNAQLAQGLQTGTLPDLAGLPGPGQMTEYAAANKLIDLGSVLDVNTYKSQTAGPLVDLGTVNGKLVGVFIKTSVKGLIWYNPKTVDVGSNAPKTWDDLQKLITDNQSKAKSPWCVAVESGDSSGWPGTDWIEDFVLRTAGPDTYKSWYEGKTKWTDPAIKKAWQMFGEVVSKAYGGSNYVLTTNFANGGDQLFGSSPGCLFHHQASFITGLGAFKSKTAGTDYNFFPFPDIDSKYSGALEGAGDLFGMFHDTPQAKALMQWLVTPDAQSIWTKRGGAISANKQVKDYPDDITKRSADLLQGAKTFVFDASDQMPTDMNAAFWSGIVDYVKNPGNLDNILKHLDDVQANSYGG